MLKVNRLLLASLVMLAGAHAPAIAADGGLDGNFRLNVISGANEITLSIVKLETKDGKLQGSIVAGGQIAAKSLDKISADGKLIRFDVGGASPGSFEGILAGDAVPGSLKLGGNLFAAQLVKTTDEKLTGQGATQLKAPEYTDAMKLEMKPRQLQAQAQREKDKEKKAELLKEVAAAKANAAKEVPVLYSALRDKHADSPLVITAGFAALRNATVKPSAEETRKWIAAMSAVAATHGPRFAADTMLRLADVVGHMPDMQETGLDLVKKAEATLTADSADADRLRVMKALQAAYKSGGKAEDARSAQMQVAKLELDIAKKAESALTDKSTDAARLQAMKALVSALKENGKADEGKSVELRLAKLELEIAKKLEAKLTDKSTDEQRAQVLKALVPALKSNGKAEEAKTAEEQLTKIEANLDKEYTAKVPPFKPEMFAGRKEKTDRRVVMELFTGAQCPPCVAADVAFDALSKSYKSADLILLQYHLHIPGPDPLTNNDTIARASYYDVNSTPSTLFNGEPAAGGGGGMANSESKFTAYCDVINPLLDGVTSTKMLVTAKQTGNKIDIKAEVNGLKDPSEKKRLRLVLVEESIRYVGGNKLRFHHHVVRALPGGANGFALNAENSQHSASVNLDELRAQIIKYLDTYAQDRPFPYADRPLDFSNLKVVGLVQDDASKEILDVLQVDVTGDVTTTRLSHDK